MSLSACLLAPNFIGNIIAFALNVVRIPLNFTFGNDVNLKKRIYELFSQIGPKNLEFGNYSLDYDTIRNYMYINCAWRKEM